MNGNFIPVLSIMGIFINGILIHENTVKNRLYTKKLNRLSRLENLTILYLSDKYKYTYKRCINKEEMKMKKILSRRSGVLITATAICGGATLYHNNKTSNAIGDTTAALVEDMADRFRSGVETVASVAENVTTEL